MKTLTALLFLGYASFAHADITIDPDVPVWGGGARFGIKSVSFNGTGCIGGKDTGVLVQNDILWLKFGDGQTASSGPDSSLSASRRNCSATINFTDSNKSYAIDSVAFYVDADLPSQVNATASTTWFYQGQGTTGSYSQDLHGDFNGTWTNSFDAGVSTDVWKPCGADRALTVSGSIRVTGPRVEEAKAQWQILGVRLKSRSC